MIPKLMQQKGQHHGSCPSGTDAGSPTSIVDVRFMRALSTCESHQDSLLLEYINRFEVELRPGETILYNRLASWYCVYLKLA